MKIEFVYSLVYDKILLKEKVLKKFPKIDFPKRMEEIKKEWKKYEKKILTAIPSISRLKWKESKVKCYVVTSSIPFSEPLTIPAYKETDKFIDVLTHELIHQIFMQGHNYKLSKKSWSYIFKKYDKEHFKTKIHIPVHAIHKKIFLDILKKPERLKREYETIKKNFPPQYKELYLKSWEIVEKEGYENIINEFRKGIKN